MTAAKMVPREPTQEMVSAGHKAALRSHADLRYLATMIWMAMHDAAPAAPARECDCAQELRNIADAKRFDRKWFDDDTAFADWAQSRARHCLSAQAAPAAEPHKGEA